MRNLIWSIVFIASMAFGQVPEIADVHTIADLKAVPAIHLEGVGDIHLGISDGGEDAGPWDVLYCLIDSSAPTHQEIRQVIGDRLGPVFVTCEWDERHVQADMEKAIAQQNSQPGMPLYAMTIPLTQSGICHVKVFAAGKNLLSTKDIAVVTPKACYWSEFASLSKTPGGYPCQVRYDVAAVLPTISGFGAIATISQPIDTSAPSDPKTNQLPGAIPLTETWWARMPAQTAVPEKAEHFPLKLNYQDGSFVISSEADKLLDMPDIVLMARWWVNGKAIEAVRAETQDSMQINRAVESAMSVQVAAGLPGFLGKLSVGDEITLQLLYDCQGARRIPKNAGSFITQLMLPTNGSQLPLETNPIKFTATQKMLDDRTTATQPDHL